MKIRLAFAMVALALAAAAFTPTHTAAAEPSGVLRCVVDGRLDDYFFGKGTAFNLRGAVRMCIAKGGHVTRVLIAHD